MYSIKYVDKILKKLKLKKKKQKKKTKKQENDWNVI